MVSGVAAGGGSGTYVADELDVAELEGIAASTIGAATGEGRGQGCGSGCASIAEPSVAQSVLTVGSVEGLASLLACCGAS